MPTRILAFAGSLRLASYNRKLVALAAEKLRERGAEVELLELREVSVPDYDGDIEATSGLPGGAQVLREKIRSADAVVIAAPEYNLGIPGMLKNVIDWSSRPPNQPWQRKPVTLLSATGGPGGGRALLIDMRKTLSVLGAFVLPAVVSLAKAGDAFDEHGKPTSAAAPMLTQLDNAVAQLLDVAPKLAAK